MNISLTTPSLQMGILAGVLAYAGWEVKTWIVAAYFAVIVAS